jgi:two-component system LytT family response regulator
MPDCKILIADDEMLAREAIKLQLRQAEGIVIVAECSDGKETLAAITAHQPDIIFLDIQMPYLTGLGVLEQLEGPYCPVVIFVTAYDSYALQAFEHDAIDYLVKPFTEARFQKAFQKAYKTWGSFLQAQNPAFHSWQEFKKAISHFSLKETQSTISIKDGSKVYIIPLEELSYIEASGNYTTFFTPERKYLHKETLQNLEEKLPASFARIHKSVIVNTAFIKEFHSLLNGDFIVKLKTGHELRLSRNYKDRIAHLF